MQSTTRKVNNSLDDWINETMNKEWRQFVSILAALYANCVSFEFQLNSPNRILLLHLSVVCLSLSFLYLWVLINNSIMQTPLSRFSLTAIPESAAITTATSGSKTSHLYHLWGGLIGEVTTQAPPNLDPVCGINNLLIHLLQPIGLWTISCINFDRYYAICSPLHYNTLFTTKKVIEFNRKSDLISSRWGIHFQEKSISKYWQLIRKLFSQELSVNYLLLALIDALSEV